MAVISAIISPLVVEEEEAALCHFCLWAKATAAAAHPKISPHAEIKTSGLEEVEEEQAVVGLTTAVDPGVPRPLKKVWN